MGFLSSQDNDLYVTAVMAFLSTSIDDFIVFLFFIAIADLKNDQKDKIKAHGQVLVGITVAYTVIIGFSLLGLILSAFSSDEWVDLIGFVPLIIGLMKFYEIIESDCPGILCGFIKNNEEEEGDSSAKMKYDGSASENAGLLRGGDDNAVESDDTDRRIEDVSVSQGGGDNEDDLSLNTWNETDDLSVRTKETQERGRQTVAIRNIMENSTGKDVIPGPGEISSNIITRTFTPLLECMMTPFALEVFATTMAVGSDNIAIYVAVFASEDLLEVGITITLILGMVYVWYFLATLFVQFELVKYVCANYSGYIIAPLLVLLGLYVLSDSVLWEWLG